MTRRVLIVLTPALDPTSGGVQMSTVKIAQMLTAQGFEVAVYSFERSGHMHETPVTLFPAPAPGTLGNPENMRGLREALDMFSPAVVINQMPYEHAITDTVTEASDAIRIGCLRNTLYSVRNNLDSYGSRLLPAWLAPLARNPLGRKALLAFHRRRHARDLRRLLDGYDQFVMFGEPNLEELAYFVPDYDPEKITLIPNTIERVAGAVPQKDKRVLWLGRLSEDQKRADIILPLWRQISAALPYWWLDVVGDGPLLPTLQRQAAAEKLPRIVFHGRQPSQRYFERAAIYFMTSDFEGFPNTLLEAQSHGAVPVAFDSYPMARSLVSSGHNGLLVPNRQIQQLARSVISLATDADYRTALAQGALNDAARFTEHQVARDWHILIQNLLGVRSNT